MFVDMAELKCLIFKNEKANRLLGSLIKSQIAAAISPVKNPPL